jgi:hypothetical protein
MKKHLLLSFRLTAAFILVFSFSRAEVVSASVNHTLSTNEIIIQKQPESVTVCVGASAYFYVLAEGENLIYQWQVYTGFTYVDINGAESNYYMSPPVEKEMDGSLYRCVITDQNEEKIYSEAAVLTVKEYVSITSDPQPAHAWENGTAVFEVTASDEGVTYAWFINRGGVPEYIDGANTSRLQLNNVGVDQRGLSYACEITSVCGTIISASAELGVYQPSLCMATYDRLSGKNKLVVALDESENFPVVDSLRVFRDGVQIGRIEGSYYTVYTDNTSNPESSAYAYSIAVRGLDGAVTPLSVPHKTVLLSRDKEENGITITWNSYEGAGIAEYAIYRGDSNDAMELISTVSDGVYSFTDYNPPLSEKLYYQIEMHWVICFPGEDLILGSNILEVDNMVTSLQKVAAGKLNVYPNPARESITIEGVQQDDLVTIMDLSGRVVKSFERPQSALSLLGIESGMYILEVSNTKGRKSTPIIVE